MKFKFCFYPTTFVFGFSMDHIYQKGSTKRWPAFSISIGPVELLWVNQHITEVLVSDKWVEASK